MNNKTSAVQKLAIARLLLTGTARTPGKMPYLADALLSLCPREEPGMGTMGVTKHAVLMYDPEVVEKWTIPQIAGVLVHEVCHLLRGHHKRGERYGVENQRLANLAGDLTINPDVVAAGLELPGNCAFPRTFGLDDNLTMEEYYDLLQKQCNSGGGGKSKAGAGDGKGTIGHGRCGSCGGNPLDGEPQDGGKKEGRSEVDIERMRRQAAESIRDYQEAKGVSSVPAGLVRLVGEILAPPRVPWQQKIARAVRGAIAHKAGAVDYKYDAPGRRQAAFGYEYGKPVLPRLRQPLPRVAVVVDTSGSMSAQQLEDCMTEIRGITRAVGADVDFCACDADVHELRPVTDWRQARALLKGGGGTDFRPAFDALAKRPRKPDVVVFMTDGWGPAPDEPPVWARTIWLLVGEEAKSPCGWGEQIKVEAE